MKHLNQPKNPGEFKRYFSSIIPSIKIMKFFGHTGSFLLSNYAIFLLCQHNLPDWDPFHVLIISLILATPVSIFIEHCISTFFPIWFRVILKKKFANIYWKTMFAFLTVVCLPLLVASPLISAVGGWMAVDQSVAIVEQSSLEDIQNQYAPLLQKERKFTAEKKSQLAIRTETEIEALEKSYAAKLKANELEKQHHKNLFATGAHPWAAGHVRKAREKRARLKAELATKKAELQSRQNKTVSGYDQELTAELLLIKNEKQVDITALKNNDTQRSQRRDSLVKIGGTFFIWIGVFCSLLSVGCYFLIELYYAAVGNHPNDNRAVPPRWFNSWKDRIFSWRQEKVLNGSDRTIPLERQRLRSVREIESKKTIPALTIPNIGAYTFKHIGTDGEVHYKDRAYCNSMVIKYKRRLNAAQENYDRTDDARSYKAILNNKEKLDYWLQAVEQIDIAKDLMVG